MKQRGDQERLPSQFRGADCGQSCSSDKDVGQGQSSQGPPAPTSFRHGSEGMTYSNATVSYVLPTNLDDYLMRLSNLAASVDRAVLLRPTPYWSLQPAA
jgi:hypothetical protein